MEAIILQNKYDKGSKYNFSRLRSSETTILLNHEL
jgi:hypothetical protein